MSIFYLSNSETVFRISIDVCYIFNVIMIYMFVLFNTGMCSKCFIFCYKFVNFIEGYGCMIFY